MPLKTTLRKNGTLRVQSTFPKETKGLCQKHFLAETDINNIMKNYLRTGHFPLSDKRGVFADVSTIKDYQKSLHEVMAASDAFNALPAQLRKQLDNNPANLIPYLQDPRNDEESIKLGLKIPNPQHPHHQNNNDLNDDKISHKKSTNKTPSKSSDSTNQSSDS